MHVGGRILVGNKARATLGCFIHDGDGDLGFTVPRHATVKDPEDSPLFTPVSDTNVIGKIRTDTNRNLDTCISDINEEQVHLLKAEFYNIPYINRPFSGVWDPSDLLRRKEQASSSDEIEKISKETILVSHVGASRSETLKESKIEFNGILHCGLIDSKVPRLQMRQRMTYPGDSGGPVFTKDYKLVGFISMGEEKGQSKDTAVVLAYYVFEFLKCSLATSV